jgi:hypothetical protein
MTKRTWANLIAVWTLGLSGAALAAEAPVQFPTVSGRDLEMRERVLPAAFDGTRRLVLVAFQRWQQDEVDSWLPAAATLAAQDPRFRYYEIPTLGRGYSWMRGFIDGGMRRGVPDPAARARTITLYLDKPVFRRALGISSEDHISVLLLDENSRVIWRSGGTCDGVKLKELQKALRR